MVDIEAGIDEGHSIEDVIENVAAFDRGIRGAGQRTWRRESEIGVEKGSVAAGVGPSVDVSGEASVQGEEIGIRVDEGDGRN